MPLAGAKPGSIFGSIVPTFARFRTLEQDTWIHQASIGVLISSAFSLCATCSAIFSFLPLGSSSPTAEVQATVRRQEKSRPLVR